MLTISFCSVLRQARVQKLASDLQQIPRQLDEIKVSTMWRLQLCNCLSVCGLRQAKQKKLKDELDAVTRNRRDRENRLDQLPRELVRNTDEEEDGKTINYYEASV